MSSRDIFKQPQYGEADEESFNNSSNSKESSSLPKISKNNTSRNIERLKENEDKIVNDIQLHQVSSMPNNHSNGDILNKKFECQYPIHPESVTEFIDIDDGRKVDAYPKPSSKISSNPKSISENAQDDNMRIFSINEVNEKFPNNYISTTKYSFITFFPLCLLKQFARIANVYFLVIAILASIPQISSLTPYTAIFPLVFVLLVSIFREGVEDFYRYRSDRASNSKKVKRLGLEGNFEDVPSKDLEVGDVVYVEGEDTFAADIILLKSSNEVNAFIQTSSLDGEKNLKKRFVPKGLEVLTRPVLEKEYLLGGKWVTLPPDKDLKSFVGNMKVSNQMFPLSIQQLLLKDSKLKNTSWIIGAVVYTGKHTKVMMNSQKARVKRSNIEK